MGDVADVVVVGAGAAGVSAALVAAGAGARVVLLDNGPAPGGQYHRPPTGSPEWSRRVAALGIHQATGRVTLCHGVFAYAAERHDEGIAVHVRGDDRHPDATETVAARTAVIATGAHDRHLPFPGWTLPGVMAGGAAQALVKGGGVLPGQRIVVAGTGPFLLAVAHTILSSGGSLAAVVEANRPVSARLVRAGSATGPDKAAELARFVRSLARHRVPYLHRHRVLAAHGDPGVASVTIAPVDSDWHATGPERVIACDTLAVGYGFSAHLDLLGQLGAQLTTSADGGLAVDVDDDQRTSIPDVYAAGEVTGIGGVDLAGYEGLVAGVSAARSLGLTPRLSPGSEVHVRQRIDALRRFADALARTFPIRDGWKDELTDATIVCRCEEVPAARVREAIDALGATDARTVKLLTRAGMGWCQGRICGTAVERMCPAAGAPGGMERTVAAAAAARRPLAVPVPLGAIAAHHAADERITP